MITRLTENGGYATVATIAAPAARVFEALTTLDGLAGWWTPAVTGSPLAGGELTFRFGDQRVVMRVDRADPAGVRWLCIEHNALDEWPGTTLTFDLRSQDDDTTVLTFRHIGLVPALDCYGHCEQGWDRFMGSLAAYADGRGGAPWSSETQRPAHSS